MSALGEETLAAAGAVHTGQGESGTAIDYSLQLLQERWRRAMIHERLEAYSMPDAEATVRSLVESLSVQNSGDQLTTSILQEISAKLGEMVEYVYTGQRHLAFIQFLFEIMRSAARLDYGLVVISVCLEVESRATQYMEAHSGLFEK